MRIFQSILVTAAKRLPIARLPKLQSKLSTLNPFVQIPVETNELICVVKVKQISACRRIVSLAD